MENLRKIRERELITIVDAMDVQALFDRLAHRGRMITIMRMLSRICAHPHSARGADLVIQYKLIKRQFNKIINQQP
jgi:hypothetical protein